MSRDQRAPMHPMVISFAKARAAREPAEVRKDDWMGGESVQVQNDAGKQTKANENIVLGVQERKKSRISYPVTNTSSNPACTPYSDEEFARLVASQSVRKLRTMFPHEHSSHTAMIAREKDGRYTIHPDMKSLKGFLSVMGQAPSPDHTVDRIDTHDTEYAPSKVRWATKREQANNRSTTITLPFDGEHLPLTIVAEKIGQKPDTLYKRLNAGWRAEEVVAGRRASEAAPLTADGWPAGATVSRWEGPYKGFEKTFGSKLPGRLSRAVFFDWIARNHLDAANLRLAEDFPQYFSPETDPDNEDPLPAVVSQHPSYLQAERLRPMVDEAHALVCRDPEQLLLWQWFRKHHRRAIDQKDAIKAMSNPTPRRPR
ncbi:hypothetical protein [Rhizobium jaguaris]|uniref:Uncharacterized protein n=1 Tax=Rhizobium jaguaris TaxID=1312183 RepID=A0A387FLX0_9HYPH|nr:hypothetical protein [Rhizobium jaguaris]AYG60430.1 hypothetical protein CCGE525_17660 [Rhizobium jaguaris]